MWLPATTCNNQSMRQATTIFPIINIAYFGIQYSSTVISTPHPCLWLCSSGVVAARYTSTRRQRLRSPIVCPSILGITLSRVTRRGRRQQWDGKSPWLHPCVMRERKGNASFRQLRVPVVFETRSAGVTTGG